MARDPATDRATLRTIHDAAQSGRHVDAAALAEAAFADGLEHPLVLNLLALKREEQNRILDAEDLLKRAVNIAPTDIGARNALGLCLLRLDRPADALTQFTALLDLDPSLPFVHASLGNTLFALGRFAEAEARYRRAVELDARQGIALAGLARIAVGRAEYPEARGMAERALAVIPGFPDAAMSLAAADLGERDLAAAEPRIRALLDDSRLSPTERAYANGLLGDTLDAKNDTDQAFAAYTLCNHELRRVYAVRFAKGRDALDYARSMNSCFERTRPEIWSSRAPPDARCTGAAAHVFLLGFPRSGTTLLDVILKGHRDVVGLDDNESMIDAVREFMQRPQDLDGIAAAPDATLVRLRTAYWQRVAAAGVEVPGKVFIDKNPLNTLKMPLISRLFPDAKILFACRDPRDIVFSSFRHRFAMSAPYFELLSVESAARYYDAVMRLSLRFIAILAPEICLVRHEDVVAEFGREMKRICTFLAIDWDPAMGDFALRSKSREAPTPNTAQLVKALNTEGIGQWRRYRAHLAPVLDLLDPWVKRFYYED
ncbi:MAG TPA: sulfotransferase [Steroidobacteraceae bacterium]|nr:sulfotransferase [Steroidobacteraceae bacterium]